MNDLLSGAIAFVLMNFTATFTVVGMVVAAVIIVVQQRRGYDLWVTLLNWFLLVGIGITYIYNGIMHTVYGDLSASLIGWDNNGFQAEVGYASLGMGIVGVISASKRLPMSAKFLALVVPACFLWGAAATHIIDIVQHGNYSSHNAGTVLYTDIIIPIVGFALWFAALATRRRGAARNVNDEDRPA